MFDRSKWEIKVQNPEAVSYLSNVLDVSPICARLLINRGYSDASAAKAFMNKTDVELYDPYLLRDMDKAVTRIKTAVENGEKIMVYGDYDVDGVTSVTVLYTYLRDRGAKVDYYIPSRENEGYGLNSLAIETIAKDGSTLIITVDTGITANEDVKFAKEIGVDVVVTDHHQCHDTLPEAEAVVNPHRPDCEYPFKDLSGVGVAFKTACALELAFSCDGNYDKATIGKMCNRYIDLVALGTIADVMPLVGENRIIVSKGLKMLRHTTRHGLKALMTLAGIDTKKPQRITASSIGYLIAPRINAAGRMGGASRAVHLFLADSDRMAEVVAEELCSTNKYRKEVEDAILKEALEQIEKERDPENEKVLVLAGDKWHHGVIGIVAAKLAERYGLPCVLISFDGSVDEGKGSARSIKGINLADALAFCSDTLTKYGGHEQAAGLSVKRDMLDKFREKFSEYVKARIDSCEFENKTVIEAIIKSDDITERTVNSISELEPFGEGNPVPLFALTEAKIVQQIPLKDGKFTKFVLERDGKIFQAPFFFSELSKQGFAVGDRVDVVCELNINTFGGTREVQLMIRDMDFAGPLKIMLTAMQKECDGYIFENAEPFEADLPDRALCADIYRKIVAATRGNVATVTIKRLIAGEHYSKYASTGIALAAFSQLGFINIEKASLFEYKITVLKTDGKKDIFAAPIMSQKRG